MLARTTGAPPFNRPDAINWPPMYTQGAPRCSLTSALNGMTPHSSASRRVMAGVSAAAIIGTRGRSAARRRAVPPPRVIATMDCAPPRSASVTAASQMAWAWGCSFSLTRDARDIEAFHAEHKNIILKPLDGMGGKGIFRVGPDGLNLGSITETLNQHGEATLMVQRFLPEIAQGDKRILLIDGAPVPFSLARIPQGSEIRGNLAAGGKGVAQPLSARDLEIAQALGPVLAARGLLLVGLDVIGDCLTEVNVTSPTCFQEITDQAGFDVAKVFIDALEKRLACPVRRD